MFQKIAQSMIMAEQGLILAFVSSWVKLPQT